MLQLTNKSYHLITLLVLLVIIGIKEYAIVQHKEELFLDEVWSFYQANYPLLDFNGLTELYEQNEIDIDKVKEDIISNEFWGKISQADFLEKLSITGEKKGFHYSNIISVPLKSGRV